MASVVIVGLPEAMAKVGAIPVVAETVGETALQAGKIEMAAAARALAPRQTGALAASIIPVAEGVAALQQYGRFVEFGTRYMDAQPFMDTAVERVGPVITREITEVVKRALYAL